MSVVKKKRSKRSRIFEKCCLKMLASNAYGTMAAELIVIDGIEFMVVFSCNERCEN